MDKLITIDELHIRCLVPHDLPDTVAQEVTNTLIAADFRSELVRVIEALLAKYPALRGVRIELAT